MRILNILSGIMAISMLFTSCGDEFTNSAEPSDVTFLPTLTLNGPHNVVLDCTATGYDDPGLTAEEAGNELEVVTALTAFYFGASEISAPDIYNISYSALNKDGIPGADMRRVFFPPCNGDLVTSIAGVYRSSVVRVGRDSQEDLDYVLIREMGDDKYELSSSIGGYYDLGLGYGSDYAAKGSVVSFDGSTYSATEGVFPIWGNIVQVSDFQVDPGSKTITYHGSGDFGDGEFDVTLTQVSL